MCGAGWGSLHQFAAQDGDGLAAEDHALPLRAHPHDPATRGHLVADQSLRPRRSAQKGASAQCAEPVTGSSSTPTRGAKKREAKSKPFDIARLVTMTPRAGIWRSSAISGRRVRSVFSSSTSTSRSERVCPTQSGSARSARASSGGASMAVAGVAGKSISIQPSARRRALKRPLRVSKRASASGARCPSSQSTCALARVAWPQSATSVVGVNQRRSNPSSCGSRNAVSERFISRATSCIHASLGNASSTQTAAGLPEKR